MRSWVNERFDEVLDAWNQETGTGSHLSKLAGTTRNSAWLKGWPEDMGSELVELHEHPRQYAARSETKGAYMLSNEVDDDGGRQVRNID